MIRRNKNLENNKILKTVKEYVIITFGAVLAATAIYLFML
jgi:hypothetical protein